MKKLVCEMCGSSDLIKEDGVFVCQSCGCKYSVEEAKKMMIDGTVEVQGVVEVDNSKNIERYLQNARRAKQKEDWEETEKYYNLVEQYDPKNIEAIFYSAYGRAKNSLIDGDIYKRQQVFKILSNCVSVLDDNYQVDKSDENEKVILEISADIKAMCSSEFVFTEWKNGYGVVTKTDKADTYKLFIELNLRFFESIGNIVAIDPKEYLYRLKVEHIEMCWQIIQAGKFDTGLQPFVKWREESRKQFEEYITQIKPKKLEEYWGKHEDKKKELLDKEKELENKINQLEEGKNSIPGYGEQKSIEKQIEKVNSEIEQLGLFKTKEKKEKRSVLAALNEKLEKIKSTIAPQISNIEEDKLKLSAQILEIEYELNRDR